MLENTMDTRQKNELLAKNLWILFWVFIPQMVGAFLSNYGHGFISTIGDVIVLICMIVYALLLLKLTPISRRFQKSAFFIFANIAVHLFISIILLIPFLMLDESSLLFSLIILVPLMVFGLFAEYFEYKAYSEILTNVNDELALKWQVLWNVYLFGTVSLFITMALAVAVPVLGLLLLLISLIIVLVVSILKLVYLYRTATLFRTLCEQNRLEH